MRDPAASAWLTRQVRAALRYLYDKTSLRRSPLLSLLRLPPEEDPSTAVRRVILEGIEELKPDPRAPAQASAWLDYRILYERYVEQFPQEDVAMHLALSTRQVRRHETRALRALVDNLLAHSGLPSTIAESGQGPALDAGVPSAGRGITPGREEELGWLALYPSEPVPIGELLRSALETVSPLLRDLSVTVEQAVPESLPCAVIQLISMRQALSNLIAAAIRAVPHGRLRMAVQARGSELVIHVQTTKAQATSPPLNRDDLDNLDIARQMVGFSRGSLEVTVGKADEYPFWAELVLPAQGQVTVLVVDDNPGALQLLERYLEDTRYRLVGTGDPHHVLDIAERVSPSIILLDVMLPGVDGWELLGRLHEHPRTRHIPIIICTILAHEQLALALGAAAFVRKPFSRAELLSTLDQQVERIGRESG